MYIITCTINGEEKKLVNDKDIKYNWGDNIFNACIFETKDEAVNFILNEPNFKNIVNNKRPFLLLDIDIDSVCIKKIEEIIYKNVASISFNNLLKKIEK